MNYEQIISTAKPVLSELPGGWEPDIAVPSIPKMGKSMVNTCIKPTNTSLIISDVLSWVECQSLIAFMQESPVLEPVSVQGFCHTELDAIGSHRTTVWSPELAQKLWYRLKDFVHTETFHKRSPTDWWQGDETRNTWEPIGISPMLRFMRYEKGGEHYAHYDAGFIYPDDNYRTLKSVVFYLTTNEDGGATRFIDDWQQGMPVWDRNHHDWIRKSREDEVIFKSKPIAGNALIFNHRECHDVEQYVGKTPRIIIRTDILYKAVK
jgi:hypothetical protein